jgi:hypothetical protein
MTSTNFTHTSRFIPETPLLYATGQTVDGPLARKEIVNVTVILTLELSIFAKIKGSQYEKIMHIIQSLAYLKNTPVIKEVSIKYVILIVSQIKI